MTVSPLDYRFPQPHQKRGHAFVPFYRTMRSGPRPRGSPRVRLSRTLPRAGPLLVLFAVAGLLALTPARAAWPGDEYGAYQWSNGSMLCVFNDSAPSVTVSAANLNGTGMGVALAGIQERSATGSLVAWANFSGVQWEPANESTSHAYTMGYSEVVPVDNATNPAQIWSATVGLTVSLDRTPVNATQADQASFQLSILDWPWQSSGDTLSVMVPLWSAVASTEHVVVSAPSSPTIDSVLNTNDRMMEYFAAGPTAAAIFAPPAGTAVPVSAHTELASASAALATLTIGSGAFGATTVTYSATLGIAPTTRVLGIPLYDYAAVAGGAGLVTLVVGLGTRRVRRRISDLTYVEEAE